MNLGLSRFDRIMAENVEKSIRRAETERYKAEVGAAARITAAGMGRPPRTATTGWGPGPEAGEMERAELAAGVKREEIAERATAASATARLKGRELGLTEEAFEFEKAFLKKKKKKKGIGAVEEIESIVASPRY